MEEALLARNAASNALLKAAISAKTVYITDGLNVTFEPNSSPLHAAYDETLNNGVPDDWMEALRKMH